MVSLSSVKADSVGRVLGSGDWSEGGGDGRGDGRIGSGVGWVVATGIRMLAVESGEGT